MLSSPLCFVHTSVKCCTALQYTVNVMFCPHTTVFSTVQQMHVEALTQRVTCFEAAKVQCKACQVEFTGDSLLESVFEVA